MKDPTDPNTSPGSRSSPSAIGRLSGGVARLLGGPSTAQAAGRFLRRQLWAWPIIATIVLGSAGWWVQHLVEDAMRKQRAMDLNAVADASVKAIGVWLTEQRVNVQLIAEDEQLRPSVEELLQLAQAGPPVERHLLQAPAQESLRTRLKQKLSLCGYVGFFVVAPGGIVVAADQDAPVGKALFELRKRPFDAALAGQTLVTRPFRSPLLLTDARGEPRANLPTMFVVGPLRDHQGRPRAALGLRIRPEDQFTRILQAIRFGDTGETYAFDRNGLLLSASRFDDELKQIGLLADLPDASSVLTVELRDPQVNMVEGERPTQRRAEQPLTHLALAAGQGDKGHDVVGHRDYRGVPSVGAWRWLPEYDFGIATEVDVVETFQPVYLLRRAFWVLIALLVLAAAVIFAAMLYIARQQRTLQQAALATKQLGQYALGEKVGAGGMGSVYKAQHALLRRPTAIKLLDVDKMSPAAVTRFEREVQLTSALTHPNTVAVFDYGRTPEGLFYYAMEYLDGMNLEDFIKRYGALPEARMVYLLRQLCGSLAEAHQLGLVHRDIKPANIILTCRGGLHDFVKVLDFGLVKALAAEEQTQVTSPNVLMGTPLYLSPEAVSQPETVDARADVYAVGAVAYFMLTGTPVFTGGTVIDICRKHLEEVPVAPSVRSGKPVSAALEMLLLRCLAKVPGQRPDNAAELLRHLDACPLTASWTAADAAAWWERQQSLSMAATLLPPRQESEASAAAMGSPFKREQTESN